MRAILIGAAGICASVATSWGEPVAQPTPRATAPAGHASAGPAAPAPTSATSPAADRDPDPAWQAYDDAFSRAAAGDRAAASTRLDDLSQRWPLHPAAARATSLVRASEPRPLDPDAPSRVARGELVFWSTVGGVFTAANVCVIAGCNTPRETAAVYTIGVGGSLALAVAASLNGVAEGEAQLYNSAQTWGSWNGLAINNHFAKTTGEAAVALGSQGVGLLAGVGLWRTWHPTQGDVALTNSFLLWSTVLTLWGGLAAEHEPTLREMVVAGDIGLVLGGLTSTRVRMSRGRTLLIDVGGVLGILGGGLVAVGSGSETVAGVSLMVGTAAGLGIAAAVTTDWDVPVTIAPTRITGASGARAWGVSAVFGW